jgi:5-methylcytosine-specific restriction endonuclease McrA
MTRHRVHLVLAAGNSPAEIARTLGVTKSTVAYHARRVREPDPRFRRRYDWKLIQAYYEEGHSVNDCVAYFGFSKKSWHAAKQRGDIKTRPNAMPIEELLAAPRDRGHLKSRLRKEGLLPLRCGECGLGKWRGRPIALELHHINGHDQDDRLENLTLLCPNCHSQTDSWGGRNSNPLPLRDRAPGREELGDRFLEPGVEHQQDLVAGFDHGVGLRHEAAAGAQHGDDQAAFG